MTTYCVRVSAPMLEMRPWLPVKSWRITEYGSPDRHGYAYCTAEDDDAPPELEGALVVPPFRHHADGSVTVISREVLAPPQRNA